MNTTTPETLLENNSSDPQKLRSMEFVEESMKTEVKEIKRAQRAARFRALTDMSLMLLTILVTMLAYMWMM